MSALTATAIEHAVNVELETQRVEAQHDGEDDLTRVSRLVDSTVPDGGYGWVVVACCFVLTFWFVGTTYSWGILQGALVKQHVASASTLAFVGSLTVACLAMFALVSGRMLRALGATRTALIGVTILSLGELLSGFSTRSIGGLFVCAGLVMGVGVSLLFSVVSTTTAQYFSRKRGLANGIIFAGGGLGGAAISFAMDALVRKVGVAWTFRVIGFVTLVTGIPAAWCVKERAPIRTATFVEWRLFRDYRFVLIFICGAIGVFPLFVPPFFLPLYSASLGFSSSTGAGLVAGFNFASAIGRIGCGFLCDVIGPLNALFFSFLLCAISMLAIWPVAESLAPLIIFVIVNGAANGGFFSVMPTVVGNVFGSARVGVAMGMVVTGWTGGYLLGAPIAGYLLDSFGGQEAGFKAYRPAIFYAGSLAVVAAGTVACVRLKMNARLLEKL